MMFSLDRSVSSVVSLVMWNTRVGEKFDNSPMWPKWQVDLWLEDELRQVLEGKAMTTFGILFHRYLVYQWQVRSFSVDSYPREQRECSKITRGCTCQVLWFMTRSCALPLLLIVLLLDKDGKHSTFQHDESVWSMSFPLSTEGTIFYFCISRWIRILF